MHFEAWQESAALVSSLLLRASLHAFIFVAIVWVVCRFAKSLPAATRFGLWWLACVAPLVQLAWARPAELPLLRASTSPLAGVFTTWTGGSTAKAAIETVPAAGDAAWSAASIALVLLVAVWGVGFLLQIGRTLHQCRDARRIVQSARPLAGAPLGERFAALAAQLGVERGVGLRASSEIESAQVVGLVSPVVVLPERDLASLAGDALDLTLAHELLHVRRGDLWLGWFPVLVQRLFWFHPAVGLALREYVLAREAACDAHVLAALDASPRTYGRLLLDLGIVRRETGAVAAGMAPSPKALERRLRMLQQASESVRAHSRWWSLVVLAAAIGTVPFRVVAVGPKVPRSVESTDTRMSTSSSTSTSTSTSTSSNGSSQSKGHSWSYSTDGDEDGRGFVFIRGDEDQMMSGSGRDWRMASRLHERDGRDLILFREADTFWVVRDPALIAEADRLLEPQRELGGQQGELGARQGALGADQAELGAQQAVLGSEQAKLGHQQAQLSLKLATSDLKESERDALQEKIHELSRKQSELGEKQGKLGEKQGALGERQGELGKQQSALGQKQQAAAEKARPELWRILERAQSAGLAEKVEG